MVNKKYAKFKLEGTCRRCGADPLPGKTRCEKCHSAHLGYQNKSKAAAIADGRCRYCLVNPFEPGRSMCATCLTKHGSKQKANYHKRRNEVILRYGGRCKCCGNSNQKYLQLDHINNDGATHRRELANGRGGCISTWAYRNGFPDNLQLLCANCHQAKTAHGGCDDSDHPPFIE